MKRHLIGFVQLLLVGFIIYLPLKIMYSMVFQVNDNINIPLSGYITNKNSQLLEPTKEIDHNSCDIRYKIIHKSKYYLTVLENDGWVTELKTDQETYNKYQTGDKFDGFRKTRRPLYYILYIWEW